MAENNKSNNNYDEDTQKDMYLTFHVANEDYAIDISYVTEIIGIQVITAVPDMPKFIKGVINLRGKIIPAVDVRLRFKLETREYNDRTCIIVVEFDETLIGLIVDEVKEVCSIPESQVEPVPTTLIGKTSRFIQGIGKLGEEVKIILDVSKLLYDDELEKVKDAGLSGDGKEIHEKSDVSS